MNEVCVGTGVEAILRAEPVAICRLIGGTEADTQKPRRKSSDKVEESLTLPGGAIKVESHARR
jgi:hypothetical protein